MRQFKMICVITLAILCMVGMAYATPKGTISDPDSKEVIKVNTTTIARS